MLKTQPPINRTFPSAFCLAILACAAAVLPASLVGEETPAAAAPPSETKPSETPEVLPPKVDLRPRFAEWGLTQRNQGKRGTCSVFASVEALEFAFARATGSTDRLSVEFANWAANAATGRSDDGDFFHNIIRGIKKHGICSESLMPYQRRFVPARAPSEEAIAEASRFREKYDVVFHWIRRWSKTSGLEETDIGKIKKVLASGHPVSAGSYHSILFVGYEDDPKAAGGGRFFVADSEERVRELTYDAAQNRMSDLFWVEVVPKVL